MLSFGVIFIVIRNCLTLTLNTDNVISAVWIGRRECPRVFFVGKINAKVYRAEIIYYCLFEVSYLCMLTRKSTALFRRSLLSTDYLFVRVCMQKTRLFPTVFIIFCFIVIFIIHAKIGQKTGRTRLCALK